MKGFLYRLFGSLFFRKGIRKKISGFTLRLPLAFHSYFPKDYEEDNFLFLRECCKQEGMVLDIGAHIGLFAVCAAQLMKMPGKVYAFEPTPNTYEILRETLRINGVQDIVSPQRIALAEKDGISDFNISEINVDNANSLVEYAHDRKQMQKIKVELSSVDSFVAKNNIQKISLIKIDVEGYEYKVLLGATETLKRIRPACILSLHPATLLANGDSLESIYDLVMDHNYKIFYNGQPIIKKDFSSKAEMFDTHLIP